MTLMEGFVRNEIYIDFGTDISYGSDQLYVDYPCRFATVGFQLMPTAALYRLADRIRKDAGYRPMHAMDEYSEASCDQSGWYEFFVSINSFTDNHMGSCIEFVVVGSDSEDNEELYTIDLTTEEQTAVYNRLDEECCKYLGKSCEDLLKESNELMVASEKMMNSERWMVGGETE